MSPLIALHLTVLTLSDAAKTGLRNRRRLRLQQDPEAGLSTLEITILALGLFLIAGIAVAVLTGATQSRLNNIK